MDNTHEYGLTPEAMLRELILRFAQASGDLQMHESGTALGS